MSFGYSPGVPGVTDIQQSNEADVLWGGYPWNQHLFVFGHIDSTAVGTGSPTSLLLPGTVMAKLDSGAGWVDYDKSASDGSQQAAGILVEEVNLLDPFTAAAADRQWRILVAGPVKAGSLLLLDQQARNQLKGQGIIFDDDIQMHAALWRRVVPKSASYTVLASDHGTTFVVTGSSGAVTFTLPTKAPGLRFFFVQTDDQNMVISGSSDIVAVNNASASSLTFSTASMKIGAQIEVNCVYVGASLKWVATLRSPGVTTVTVA